MLRARFDITQPLLYENSRELYRAHAIPDVRRRNVVYQESFLGRLPFSTITTMPAPYLETPSESHTSSLSSNSCSILPDPFNYHSRISLSAFQALAERRCCHPISTENVGYYLHGRYVIHVNAIVLTQPISFLNR